MSREVLIKKIQEAEEVLKLKKRQYYSTHFYEFNRDILGWPDIYEPLHRKVCNFIQDNFKEKDLLLLLPRGTFKSSIVTVGYTLWRVVQNPNERVLIANATFPMAKSFLKQIKDHLEKNVKIKAIWGNLSKETSESWREESVTLKDPLKGSYRGKEPTISTAGVASGLTGTHYTFAILDDLVARENITTMEQIEKVKNFYKDVLDLVDARQNRRPIIIIGTTWHQADLYSWIQDPENGIIQDFKVLCEPAFGEIVVKDGGRYWEGEWDKGPLLFPKILSWNELKSQKGKQGPSHFASQYLLDPVPLDDATFKYDFKYYEDTDLTGIPLLKFMAVDPAISEKKGADYSAIMVVGVDKKNTWYILDMWRDRVNPKRLIDQIFTMDDKWDPVQVGVETNAFQKVLQFYIYDEMKRRGNFIPMKELTHTELSKDVRIRGLEPRYAVGTILHDKSNSYTKYLEDELRRFPSGTHDDLIDSLASILEIAHPPRVKEKRRSRREHVYPA